mgnify:CR=1 FL=1|jgi:hypothetical protein
MSIDLELYQCDRFWRHINVDKYPRHIKLIDLEHINVDRFGVLSMLIDLEHIHVNRFGVLSM